MSIQYEFEKLHRYMKYYVDKLAFKSEPTFFFPVANFNNEIRNPHAKDHWHGVSKPHGINITMKFLWKDFVIMSKEEFEMAYPSCHQVNGVHKMGCMTRKTSGVIVN